MSEAQDKNLFRNIFLAIIGIVALVVLFFYYLTSWSLTARTGMRNERNSYQVRLGTTVKQALVV